MKRVLSILVSFCLFAPWSVSAVNLSQPSVLENVVFLGDSTTNAMRCYEVLPGGKNTACVWSGVDGTLSMWDVSRKEIGITQAMYETYAKRKIFSNMKNIFRQIDVKNNPSIIYSAKIRDLCEYVRPSVMVITLGVNGCACMSEDDFEHEYGLLIKAIKEASPDTRIILNTIYPVSKLSAKITNQAIDTANGWIEKVARDNRVEFINTNRRLKAEDGFAPDRLIDESDGIHWNRDGYKLITKEICSEISSGFESEVGGDD